LPASGVASALVTGVLALNGYLAVRNFAFTFLGQHRAEAQLASRTSSGLFDPVPAPDRWAEG
jgi:hypothetical protein